MGEWGGEGGAGECGLFLRSGTFIPFACDLGKKKCPIAPQLCKAASPEAWRELAILPNYPFWLCFRRLGAEVFYKV